MVVLKIYSHTEELYLLPLVCQKSSKLWQLDRDFEFILSKLWFKIEVINGLLLGFLLDLYRNCP
jgi:hypothetical protein